MDTHTPPRNRSQKLGIGGLALLACIAVALCGLIGSPRAAHAAVGDYGTLEDGTYIISSYSASTQGYSKSWDIADASKDNGALVQSYTTHKGSNQRWRITTDSNGYSTIVNEPSGKALDVPWATAANGKQLQIYDNHGGIGQKWKIIECSDGYFKIVSAVDESYVIDLANSSTANGAAIQLYQDHGGYGQRWTFEKTADPEYIEAGSFQDPKYSWSPAFEAVKLEDLGQAAPLNIKSSVTTIDNNIYTNVLGHLYEYDYEMDDLTGQAMRFTDAAYSDGTKLDLVAYIKNYEKSFYNCGMLNYFVTALSQDEMAGPNSQLDPSTRAGAPVLEWCGFNDIDIEFKFVIAGTNTPYPVTGHFSFSDLDNGESCIIDNEDGEMRLLISEGNTHLTAYGNMITAKLGECSEDVGIEACTMTVLLDEVSTFQVRGYMNPYHVALYCLDSSTLVNFTPDSPTKSATITG